MRVTSFGSGSSGNALLVQSRGTAILVDVGLTTRRILQGLTGAGLGDTDLTAVLVSHEHGDHIRSLQSLTARLTCPVFATAGTARALGTTIRTWERLVEDHTYLIGALTVTALAVPHDAAEPVGFLIADGETTVSIFTDLGAPPPSLAEPIVRSHLVILEANYDPGMLARGRYPEHLKRRIRGPLGHLSNDACGAFLCACLDDGRSHARQVWLAHLSENNNRPALATETVLRHLVDATDGTGPAGANASGGYPRRVPPPRIASLPRRGRDETWDSAEALTLPRQMGLPL